jgi:hypothetical protein
VQQIKLPSKAEKGNKKKLLGPLNAQGKQKICDLPEEKETPIKRERCHLRQPIAPRVPRLYGWLHGSREPIFEGMVH